MKSGDWIQLLVGTVILGAIAWLGNTVYGLNGSLTTVSERLSFTSERVERIANVIPEMRLRIAREEVAKPATLAVVTTKPTQASNGQWYASVHVINSEDNKKSTFTVNLDHEGDKAPLYSVIGSIHSLDSSAPSFANLYTWSADLNQPSTVPSYLEPQASFVLRTASYDAVTTQLAWSDKSPTIGAYKGPSFNTWNDLAVDLEKNKGRYVRPR